MIGNDIGVRDGRDPIKVALIQGALAHSRMTNIYEGFDPRYEIVIFGAKKCDIGESNIRQEHRRLFSARDFLRCVPKVRNRIPWPDQQHLYGFERATEDIDLLFPHGSIMQFAYQCIEIKRKVGRKVVVFDLENVPYAYRHYSPQRKAERMAVLSECDAIVAALGQVKQCMLMEGVPEEKIHVIYEGVNQEVFKPGPKDGATLESLSLSPNDIVAMFVGQFAWRKGALTLLFAAKHLSQDSQMQGMPIKYVFVGRDGADDLRAFAQEIGMGDRVLVHDWIPYSKMPDVYRCSDMVIVPSIPIPTAYEQSSAAMREAATIGRCMILSYTGGMPELLGDGALYFSPSDYRGLAEHIKALALDETRRENYANLARARASEVLDAGITRQKTAALFDRVMNG